jgi:hypothetical protein
VKSNKTAWKSNNNNILVYGICSLIFHSFVQHECKYHTLLISGYGPPRRRQFGITVCCLGSSKDEGDEEEAVVAFKVVVLFVVLRFGGCSILGFGM